jgi:hypothetical protein
MKQYIILKNGNRLSSFAPTASLDLVVLAIRELESGMDRLIEHSPYTISSVKTTLKLATGN